MDEAKLVTYPMSASIKLTLADGPLFDNPTLFRSTVRSIPYLSLTRLNITYSVNKVCQFVHNSTISHWQAVKWILRYLKNTAQLGLLIRPCPNFSLHAFTNVDWAGWFLYFSWL